MRQTLVILSVLAALALPAGAGADQNDPDLDSLFDILKTSGAPAEMRAAESLIWRAWMHHDNAAYDAMMRDETRAISAP